MPYTSGRVPLFFERRGAGEPLLWITGFTISSAIFEPLLPRYARRFDCVTYDNRGAGRSAAPLLPTSMPELAADAVRVLDANGIESAHVLGASMGGMIAQELALRFPHRVRGLILAGTSPGGPRAARPVLRELALAARGGRAGLLFSPAFRREDPDQVRELLRGFRAHRPPARGVAAHWWATVYHDTWSRLGRIQAPTLVLHGEQDAMAPLANARTLAERIPGAELRVIAGAGHAFALERPEASYAALTGWLDARSPIAPGRRPGRVAAGTESMTRALGLPVGALRTGRSLVALLSERRTDHTIMEEDGDVAPDRRAA